MRKRVELWRKRKEKEKEKEKVTLDYKSK